MRIEPRPSTTLYIALLALNFGTIFLQRNALGILMPVVGPSLGLSNADVGLLSSATSILWAASGFLLTATLSTRVSARTALIGLSALTAASSLASGVASAYLMLLAARLALGLFAGPVLPLSQGLTGIVATGRHRGLMMSLMQSFGSGIVSAVIGPIALASLAVLAGWRTALLAIAALGLLSTVLLGRYLKDPPSRRDALAQAATPRRIGPLTAQLLSQRNLLLCALISVAMVGWLITEMTFYPLYLTRQLGLSVSTMGLLMTTYGLGGISGALLLPWISDRFGRRPALVCGTLLGVAGPCVLWLHPASVPLLGLALFIGATAGGTFPLFMATIPLESLPAGSASVGIGLVQGFGESLGGVAMPLAAGFAADGYGLNAMLAIVAGSAATAAAAGCLLAETAPRGKT